MKKKILITGASGFIGSFFVEEALANGFEVFAGVRKSSSKQFLQQAGITFLEFSLNSKETLSKELAQCKEIYGSFDFVIHNAGITQASKKEDFFTVNTGYTKNLIDALITSGMKLEKFCLISSLAATGPGNKETFHPIQLSDAQQPISDYGRSKLDAEQYLATVPDFPYLIIAPTGVYGPRDKDFLQFIKLINSGFELYLGAGRQMISMIYVKDLTRAVIQLLLLPSSNQRYFVSDGIDYSKEKVGDILKDILQKKSFKLTLPLTPVIVTVAGIEKIYSIFGKRPFLNQQKLAEISHPNWTCNSNDVWIDISSSPKYFLEDGMRETVSWYKENKWI